MLSGLPVSVVKSEYLVQDEQYKSLYPDMLNAVIQNNTDADIKDAVLAFVAWDSNHLPVKLVGNMDFSGGDYFAEVNYSDINLVGGSTFGEDFVFPLMNPVRWIHLNPSYCHLKHLMVTNGRILM